MKQLLAYLKGKARTQPTRRDGFVLTCNYRDNYYGDQACVLVHLPINR